MSNILYCSVDRFVICITPNSFCMETVNLPKFKWNELSDLNSGHTVDEWGKPISNNKDKPHVIFAYKMKWDLSV